MSGGNRQRWFLGGIGLLCMGFFFCVVFVTQKAEHDRAVETVKPEEPIQEEEGEEREAKKIALTFDDGPQPFPMSFYSFISFWKCLIKTFAYIKDSILFMQDSSVSACLS